MVTVQDVLRVYDMIHGREPRESYGGSKYAWFTRLVLELAEAVLAPEELDKLYKAMTTGVNQ